MRSAYFMNGQPILNFVELQRAFDPWEALREREAFASFAAIHCLPFRLKKPMPEGYVPEIDDAVFFSKEFWLACVEDEPLPSGQKEHDKTHFLYGSLDGIIDGSCLPDGYEDVEQSIDETDTAENTETIKPANKAQEALKRIAYQFIDIDAGIKEAMDRNGSAALVRSSKLAVEGEVNYLRLREKLETIRESAGLSDSREDVKTALLFLAMCELTELDPSKQSFARPLDFGKETEIAAENEITDFPEGGTNDLFTRPEPYKYRYYAADVPPNDEGIVTTRVNALQGDRGGVVRIELYNGESCVQTVVLNPGESRFFNSVQHEVIKPLPVFCMGEDVFVIRESDGLAISEQCDGKIREYSVGIPSVSSFSASNAADGFLAVRDGALYTPLYNRARDSIMLRATLMSVPNRVAEVKLYQDGFAVLLSDGSVISDTDRFPQGERRVSLDEESRMPLPPLSGMDDVCEISVSPGRRFAAVRRGDSGEVSYFVPLQTTADGSLYLTHNGSLTRQ